MRHIRIPRFILVLIAVTQTLLSAPDAFAQHAMTWSTVDGGGGTSSGGGFTMSGTIGQPDASGPLAGGGFTLTGGFWPGATPINDCPADINNDNSINVTDLLAVIGGWGSCTLPCPPNCPADIAPGNGDCAVNVTDLLAVISGWGPCP